MSEPYNYAAPPPEEVPKSSRKPLVILCLCLGLAALLGIGFLGMMRKTAVPTDWSTFDEERMAFLEDSFHMALDTAEPERYWVVSVAQDGGANFSFTVDDPGRFMQECFFGEIVKDDSYGGSYAYKCRPWPDDPDRSRQAFYVTFEKKGDAYRAKLTSYTE